MNDQDKLFEDMPSNPSMSYEPEDRLNRRAHEELGPEDDSDGFSRKADLMTWTVVQSPDPAPAPDDEPRTQVLGSDQMIQTVQHGSGENIPLPPSSPPVEQVSAQYELRKVIGAGGFGEVWEAQQRSLGRSVAVKRVRRDLRLRTPRDTRGAMAEVTFRQEAAIAGLLEHPNIVPIHDLGIDADGSPMLAMKLVRGEPWDRIIAKDYRELEPADFLAKQIPIMVQMTQAVAFAHSRGIIHRDLKPSQVMTGEFGEVLLMDWGLAMHFDRRRRPRENQAELPINLLPEKLPTIQTASNPAGTPALMAPEQTYNDASKIGFWTDIYLLGGTLYYLLTGTFPHIAETSREAFKQAQACIIERPEDRAPDRDVPQELSDLCMRALSKDPKDRVPSAAEFLKHLQDFLSGAGKRRESRALAAQVRDGLEHGRMSYDGMASLMDTLNRAKNLWSDNPELPELFDKTLNLYARQALSGGDLNLAKFEAEQIRPGETRDSLLHDIGEARKRVKAESRQHKLLSVAFVVLLVLIVAVWSVYNFTMNAERRDLTKALEMQGDLTASIDDRTRELGAIYTVSEALDQEDFSAAMTTVTETLEKAMSYSEGARARIEVDGESWGETPESDYRIETPIVVNGTERGTVAVVYTSLPRGESGFHDSEKKLVAYVANIVGKELERRNPVLN